jgi:NAD+ kinase
MKRIGMVVKADRNAADKADELEQWLQKNGVEVLRRESRLGGIDPPEAGQTAPEDLFCVLVLGGDGTFLSAVRWIGDRSIPVLGVKFGEVGFLAEITEDRLIPLIASILQGEFTTQPRMRLLVTVLRNQRRRAVETVLNDVVINKGALARLANIETSIDDHYLTIYRADGLIIATPTGSTAYSLAAGGPVVHPAVPAIVMTPICPFTLTNRPLIIPNSSTISIRLEKSAADIMLTCDGQQGIEITAEDTIIIRKSPHPIHMITEPSQNYYDVLKAKLHWSGGRV